MFTHSNRNLKTNNLTNKWGEANNQYGKKRPTPRLNCNPQATQIPAIRSELIVNKAQVSNIVLCTYYYEVSVLHNLYEVNNQQLLRRSLIQEDCSIFMVLRDKRIGSKHQFLWVGNANAWSMCISRCESGLFGQLQ